MHGQETLEDYDSCGILGDEGNRANYRPNRARIGDDYECLWDCEWQVNPFFRSGDIYWTKWGITYEQFPMVHTSPQLPKDLTCLDDCFGFYKNPRNPVMMKKRNQKRAECSAQGLDTLIPTHHQDGVDFEASHYSDMALWWKAWLKSDFTTTIGSWNPNLDCLMLLESISKRRGDHVGNFIPCGNAPQQGVSGKRIFRGSNEECLPAEGNRILRASNPLSTAVEICAFAKLLQYVKSVPPEFGLPGIRNFSFTAEAPDCDSFLPDIFSPVKCRCVGTCDPRNNPETENLPSSLLLAFDSDFANTLSGANGTSFTTEPGLMGCQSACAQFPSCQFFTFSHEPSWNVDGSSSVSKKHVCRLWDSCQSFQIPAKSTFSLSLYTISVHWSGPKECAGQHKCPLLPDNSDSYKVRILMVSYAQVKLCCYCREHLLGWPDIETERKRLTIK